MVENSLDFSGYGIIESNGSGTIDSKKFVTEGTIYIEGHADSKYGELYSVSWIRNINGVNESGTATGIYGNLLTSEEVTAFVSKFGEIPSNWQDPELDSEVRIPRYNQDWAQKKKTPLHDKYRPQKENGQEPRAQDNPKEEQQVQQEASPQPSESGDEQTKRAEQVKTTADLDDIEIFKLRIQDETRQMELDQKTPVISQDYMGSQYQYKIHQQRQKAESDLRFIEVQANSPAAAAAYMITNNRDFAETMGILSNIMVTTAAMRGSAGKEAFNYTETNFTVTNSHSQLESPKTETSSDLPAEPTPKARASSAHAPALPTSAPKNQINYDNLIAYTRRFFNLRPSDRTETGMLYIPGLRSNPVKSGFEGGPWVGTQRGHVPRGKGSGYSSGAPSQGNIGTHVEGHAIQKMWEVGAKKAVLVVGSKPCGVCLRSIKNALPKGAELEVIYPAPNNPGSWNSSHFKGNEW
ncbi:SCP1.201-like deaminase [uncultured archaeon]|nr:SCP1.201-like deaminase [uncultured archaeon]